ncbi:hypothetical protein F5Y16DRAFT_404450 [Xylariaceae sp. FL0255]|nr:hypothetical protein F5Y16DRAFT_404450 [Xylariaceae sp. FL0255]
MKLLTECPLHSFVAPRETIIDDLHLCIMIADVVGKHDGADSHLLVDYQEKGTQRSRVVKRSIALWVTLPITLVVYSALLFAVGFRVGFEGQRQCANLLFSPVADGLKSGIKTVDTQFPTRNNFKGPPSRELDDAWDALTSSLHIRISREEIERMKETSIALSDEDGGFLAGIDAIHQIHCLDIIRRKVYEYAYEELPMAEMHIDHCIDSIRQTLMCHPSDGLFMYDWKTTLRGPSPRFLARRECADWSKLQAWSALRGVSLFDTKAVVHPLYGPSFPDSPEETWEMLKHGNMSLG